ncbi:MAG TPA: 16S rRNA (cytosine(1402)-N(4))-methyltransferase RsmH [Acidimicrobiales bacterium]|nr:16S rRNA (cytosine(1402)-N(4))-methyltransferase RsmH [Acidimicrobiales bacterium]
MDLDFSHEPVMVDEVVELFSEVPNGLVVDATVGGGGHASALLSANSRLRLLGLDRDPAAVAAAETRLSVFGSRATVRHARFDAIRTVGEDQTSPTGPLVGVLFDLGVSSVQVDTPERGFSYRSDGPLDMRMDQTGGHSASELVNSASEEDLRQLLVENGEGRFARRIVEAIIAARPIETTGQLAEVVSSAIPMRARSRKGHPARRVFQALRIAVNDELNQLSTTLPTAITKLIPGGRCVAIAYHSGEDRVVKSCFAQAVSGGCACPPGLPCVCGAVPIARLVFRGARRPSPAEVERNHRSESARLRAVERVEAGSSR